MKSMLELVFNLLVVALIIFIVIYGLEIGPINIMSVSALKEYNEKMINDLDYSNRLISEGYQATIKQLEGAATELSMKKAEYEEATKGATEEEIREASIDQEYSVEYLWSKLGNYATKNNLNLKLSIEPTGVENINNLSIKILGDYAGMTEFIERIENDDNLDFKVAKFKMNVEKEQKFKCIDKLTMNTYEYDIKVLAATFTVENIRIKKETVSQEALDATNGNLVSNDINAVTTNSTNTTAANTTSNTNTTNTTNTAS